MITDAELGTIARRAGRIAKVRAVVDAFPGAAAREVFLAEVLSTRIEEDVSSLLEEVKRLRMPAAVGIADGDSHDPDAGG